MENTLIGLFDTCQKICIAFAVLFLIISVVLFFLFDIKAIFNIRTGRTKKKTIKEMENANNNTGRLRVGGKTLTSKLKEEDKNMVRSAVITPPPNSDTQSPNTTEVLTDNNQTEMLSDNNLTEVLSPDLSLTQVLRQDDKEDTDITSELSDLNTTTLGSNNKVPEIKPEDINFVVLKKQLYIHTDETIG